MMTLKGENAENPTSEEDNSVKAPVEEHKNPRGGGNNTLNRNIGAYSTSVGDRLSIHGPRNIGSMSWNPNGHDNTHSATIS